MFEVTRATVQLGFKNKSTNNKNKTKVLVVLKQHGDAK